MKKCIPFILSLFILLSGCGNKDNKPGKEITKEKALEIYNKVEDSINTYYEEIKNGEKSYYLHYYSRRYEKETALYYKREYSLNNDTNESIEMSYGGYKKLDLLSGWYKIFDEENGITKSYDVGEKRCTEYNGLELKKNSALWSWNISLEQYSLRYIENANVYSKIKDCFNNENTKYYSSKKGELYVIYVNNNIKYDYYFIDYLPVRLSTYTYDNDGFDYKEYYFSKEPCINLPDFSDYEYIKK